MLCKKKKRKGRCASQPSQFQLDSDAIPAHTYKPLESKEPEQKKRRLQDEVKLPEPEGLESEQAENSEQERPEPEYVNHPRVAQEIEGAELFAKNGAILNAEFKKILALIKQEKEKAMQEARALQIRAQVHINTNPHAIAQAAAYQQFLARQAFAQKQVRTMRPQTFMCESCRHINAAHLLACAMCGQAR